jgi:hypothetical protein
MQNLPEFVREDVREEDVKPAVPASLTGWETVIFQVVEDPPDSDSSTALLAP